MMVASGADNTTTTAAAGQNVADDKTTATTAAPSDVEASLRSELEKLRKEAASLRDESASRRIKAREESERAAKEAEAKGEYAKALETYKARVAELEGLEGDAKQWRSFADEERKRLDARKADLPAHWQSLLDRASDIDGKRAVLAAYDVEAATKGTTTAAAKPQQGGAPASGVQPIDFAKAWASGGRDWQDAKTRDPKGASAYVTGIASGGARQVSFLRPAAKSA
jgi:hypothetical protein